MAVILFYGPFNQRSRDTESLMIGFHRQGHRVICLSQQEGLQINDFLNAGGVRALSYVVPGERSGLVYFCRHLFYFIFFCWRNRIQIVYSHLEPANFVASLGQYFIRARTFICRHHVDEAHLYEFNRDLYYRLTYRLAKRIIVVSARAKNFMVDKENIPARKITHINLAYDFSLYPDHTHVTMQIRQQHDCDVLMVGASRFTKFKRPELCVALLHELRKRNIEAKLILLGTGEMHGQLLRTIHAMNLSQYVELPGYLANPLAYMAAADFFVHPSVLESSCVVVKEAGLVRTPVVACSGVGDFDDYLVDGHNAFLVERDNFVEEATRTIAAHYQKKVLLQDMGDRLCADVHRLFSIENILPAYESLNRI
jgi:glycosyltransferase involved in cell wall biosynthesis